MTSETAGGPVTEESSLVELLYADYPHAFMTQEMLHRPVQYTPGCLLIPPDVTCAGCGAARPLMRDHCHQHGWIRAIVCGSCNRKLGHIDRLNVPPKTDRARLTALVGVRNKCPDCTQIGTDDLTPFTGMPLR